MTSDNIPSGLIKGRDGRLRCAWQTGDDSYRLYHDSEWGRPCADDDRLFEKLCLEGFQAGLSWLTILRKRDAFRRRFHGFSVDRVAAMGEDDVESLLQDQGIVRHRAKIVSAIGNARRAQALRAEHGSLAGFLWSFEPPSEERPRVVTWRHVAENPTTAASIRLSKALKARGFSFVGPTTIHAFMQAMGFVNDHVEGCCARASCEADRAAFERPALPAR